MEGKSKLRTISYTIMFLVLGLWALLPYLLPDEFKLIVFDADNLLLDTILLLACGLSAFGTFINSKFAFYPGCLALIYNIIDLFTAQYRVSFSENSLQLLTLLCIIWCFLTYYSIFRPQNKNQMQVNSVLLSKNY